MAKETITQEELDKLRMDAEKFRKLQDEEEKKKEETIKIKDNQEEQMSTLLEELTPIVGEMVAGALKEKSQDFLSENKLRVDPELEKAEEKGKSFNSLSDFLTSVRNYRLRGAVDPRLAYIDDNGRVLQKAPEEKTAGHMEIATDSQGGFLVPEVYRNDLQMIALEQAIVRPHGPMVIPPIKTDSVKIPYVDDTSHASTVFGGVSATWTAERGTKTATKPTFGQMELTPHKLAGLTYTSNELLADSAIALEPLIKRMFGSAWGYFEDDAFITGTGAGQPLGILNCNCLISRPRNTVGTVYFEDLAEMYMSILPSSYPFAYWVVNPTVLPELIEMGTGNAAAASGKNVIWISQDMGASKGIPGTILGRPFLVSEKMQALGTAGDIGLFDFRYYIIFDRQPITIDVSTHVAFTTDETCWRFVLRVDGQCWPASAKTLRRGGITQSPFVVLSAATS